METKLCRGCDTVLPWSDFYLRNGRPRTECKRCEHARTTAWRQTDKGRASARETLRKYNASAAGKAKRAEYNRSDVHRKANREYAQTEAGRASMARYRQTEKRKAVKKRHYESGKGKASNARYQATDKGKESLLRGVHRRRALRLALPPPMNTLTAAEWVEIQAAYGNACAYCGRSDRPLTRDHIVPLSKGGHHVKDNIAPACRSCNSRKNNRVLLPRTPGTSGFSDLNLPD